MSAVGIKLPETRSNLKISAIHFASFLSVFSANRFDILRMSQNDFAVGFKDIVDGDPILSR